MLHKTLYLTALVAVVALAGCSPADAPDSSAAAPDAGPAAEETVTSTLRRHPGTRWRYSKRHGKPCHFRTGMILMSGNVGLLPGVKI